MRINSWSTLEALALLIGTRLGLARHCGLAVNHDESPMSAPEKWPSGRITKYAVVIAVPSHRNDPGILSPFSMLYERWALFVNRLDRHRVSTPHELVFLEEAFVPSFCVNYTAQHSKANDISYSPASPETDAKRGSYSSLICRSVRTRDVSPKPPTTKLVRSSTYVRIRSSRKACDSARCLSVEDLNSC